MFRRAVYTFFCSGLPSQGSGGSARLLGPVACCSSFAAATSRADNWPVVMPHLLNSQVGCLAKAAACGATTVLDSRERILLQLLSGIHRRCLQSVNTINVISISLMLSIECCLHCFARQSSSHLQCVSSTACRPFESQELFVMLPASKLFETLACTVDHAQLLSRRSRIGHAVDQVATEQMHEQNAS